MRRGDKVGLYSWHSILFSLILLGLGACNGDYSGGNAGNNSNNSDANPSDGQTNTANSAEFFSSRVQPRLDFCRTCHIPNGIADVEEGRRFMLSSNSGDDEANLRASWKAMGGGVQDNPLIVENADHSEPHSGGKNWPEGSEAYNDMIALLSCWDDPVSCALQSTGEVLEDLPLLDGVRGGNAWSNFCEGQPDSAELPQDPRKLVVPGINEGKAVAFNAFWRDCDNLIPHPTTCGELREQSERGKVIAHGQGQVGSPISFSGGAPDPTGLPAEDYNRLWEIWGLSQRPDNFDELVAERYGSPLNPEPNPYPLPGEDPNASNGGSGQLPMALTQIREDDGTWTGEIGQKVCIFCHNGQLGTTQDGPGMGPQMGGAGSIGDFTVASSDFGKAGDPLSSLLTGITIATNRGTGAIDFFQLAFVLFSGGDPALLANEKIVFSQAIGTIKSPPWWNLAYRPQKFHGAVLPTDSSRIDLAAYYDLAGSYTGRDAIGWIDNHAGHFQTWAETVPSPEYPFEVDTELAEQGAILFHSKDLWAPHLNNPEPQPEMGNGSCAGCHGAYSPRYTHDPAYLETPELAGVAAYALPMSVVGTDPVYADAMQSLRRSDGSTSDAIMDIPISSYCGLGNAGHTENNTPIMLAPPLWGAWAAAPYFHNGSVPNIWGVLDPDHERPRIWERVSKPAREDQVGQVVMGYDTDLQRAYDHDKLGWKYEELSCGQTGTMPYVDCDPMNPEQPPITEEILGELYTNIAILWNLPRADMIGMSNPQIEARKIYNTNEYSQGNQGHAFTSVLTDQERRAIIEYLKTL